MKILVTGGTGLVGYAIRSVITQKFPLEKERWTFLSSLNGDLRNMDQTVAIFQKYKPTVVVHLAASVGGLFMNLKNKVELYIDNVTINNNVLQCCHKFNVEKVISCLSTCVFPAEVGYPIDESMLHCGPPHPSNEGYAYAKRMIDVLNKCYHDEYNCMFTSVIPTNIYGPNDNYNLEKSHVVPALIHKFYLAKHNNTSVTIGGSGKPLRQFIYSEDLADLIIWTLKNYNEIEPLIIATPESDEISIKELAFIVAQEMNFTGEILFDETKPDGQFKKTASPEKLLKLTSYNFTPLNVGIKRSVDWFVNNFNKARK